MLTITDLLRYTGGSRKRKGGDEVAVYGYHRTSTAEQRLDRGVAAIREYCEKSGLELDEMFTDQRTGKSFDRPDYLVMKRMARKPGDIIVISELDRLGRNKESTLKELRHFKALGVRVMILEIPTTLMDYSALGDSMAGMMMETINNMLVEVYATFAHAEMVKRESRQRQGIQAMRDRGEWGRYGRPPAIDREKFAAEYQKVLDGQVRPFDLMRKLGMKKSTFYKYAAQCRAGRADPAENGG